MDYRALFSLRSATGWLRSAFSVMALCCFCIRSDAQKADPEETDLRALTDEVRQLTVQQQQILQRLEDLKQLLVTNQGGLAVPLPTSSTSVVGEGFLGLATASVVIIEYGDFECVYCRTFQKDTYPLVRDAYINTGKVRYYFRDLPLPIHPYAMPAALAARCASDQGKYWQMHDKLFSGAPRLTPADLRESAKGLGLDVGKLEACISSDRVPTIVKGSMDDAAKMGIRATPTFLIGNLESNGSAVKIAKNLAGVQSFEVFKATISPLLAAPGPSGSQSQRK
jgi:protein-disulfide isomerase